MQWVALVKGEISVIFTVYTILTLHVSECITEKQRSHSKIICGKVLGFCRVNLGSRNSQTRLYY